MDLERITKQTIDIAKTTGAFIKNNSGKLREDEIEKKGIHDFVTEIDKESEKKIIDGLRKIFPEAGFIAEEQTNTSKGKQYNWIIDPLDGTTNYIHNQPPFAVSIALQENSETILGVIYEIGHDEVFYAYKNSPAFLNGKKIQVSQAKKLNELLVATGFPFRNFQRLDNFMESLRYFFVNTQGVRRLGSAATDLAYVACGRFDAFYEYNLSPWDVAAGAFIVERAGGIVADFNGKDNYIFGKEIIATNHNIYNIFLDAVQKHML